MKCKVREFNNDVLITQKDIAIVYSRVTYKPAYETLTGKSFKELTEETIEVMGGIRTNLQIGKSREPGTEIEQRRYKFPGQKGTLEASIMIKKLPYDAKNNALLNEEISLFVGLYDFNKDSFYNKLLNAMTDLQRYKKTTKIHNCQIDF